MRSKNVPAEIKAAAITHAANFSMTKAAKKFGVSYGLIWLWCYRLDAAFYDKYQLWDLLKKIQKNKSKKHQAAAKQRKVYKKTDDQKQPPLLAAKKREIADYARDHGVYKACKKYNLPSDTTVALMGEYPEVLTSDLEKPNSSRIDAPTDKNINKEEEKQTMENNSEINKVLTLLKDAKNDECFTVRVEFGKIKQITWDY